MSKKKYLGVASLQDVYAEKYGVTKNEAYVIVKNMLGLIEEVLLDPSTDGIQIVDFITLERVYRKPKKGRNPKFTDQEILIPGHTDIKCKTGNKFHKQLNVEVH